MGILDMFLSNFPESKCRGVFVLYYLFRTSFGDVTTCTSQLIVAGITLLLVV